MTIYEELLRAAQTGRFAPQMIGELEHVYLSRLAMAASVVTDEEWNRLSKGAADWCNFAAVRINSGLVMDLKCPGFGDPIPEIDWPLRQPPINGNHVALVDAPPDLQCRIADDVEEVEPDDEEDTTPKPPPVKTDLIRACVIEHPDWEHPKIMAYLGPGANPNTVSTVRSITLATMNIARSLGKWRD
jgi:hypothetical protein